MEKPNHSKWKLTLKLERGDGKVYAKQIDSGTGSEYRISSRPDIIPLTPEKHDIETHGLYFRAKHRVHKELVFNLPENTVFDEVKAELKVVTKENGFKSFAVERRKNTAQKELKIGDSGAQVPSIH